MMTPRDNVQPTHDSPRPVRGIDFDAAYTVLIRVWLRRQNANGGHSQQSASQSPPLP